MLKSTQGKLFNEMNFLWILTTIKYIKNIFQLLRCSICPINRQPHESISLSN